VPASESAIHLRPTAELAERVLLPGDPGRALSLAQSLLERPLMFNHHRGLWGYTGTSSDGELLTIQSTGMGGPSAAIVLTELIALGVRKAIRVGTCGALAAGLELGDLVVATGAICADGTSAALGARERVFADPALTQRLLTAAPDAHSGPVVSVDLFYDDRDVRTLPGARQAVAVEMEAATLFAVGVNSRVPVACVLAVSDTFDRDTRRVRIDDDTLLAAAEAMGDVAVRALQRD
jgi:DeoD family purine-nucleoside phosphorylase